HWLPLQDQGPGRPPACSWGPKLACHVAGRQPPSRRDYARREIGGPDTPQVIEGFLDQTTIPCLARSTQEDRERLGTALPDFPREHDLRAFRYHDRVPSRVRLCEQKTACRVTVSPSPCCGTACARQKLRRGASPRLQPFRSAKVVHQAPQRGPVQ